MCTLREKGKAGAVTRDVPAKLGERVGQREERGGEQDDIVTGRIEKNDRGTRWGTFYRRNTELSRSRNGALTGPVMEGTALDACFVHRKLKDDWNEEKSEKQTIEGSHAPNKRECAASMATTKKCEKTVVEGSYAPNKREPAANAHNVGKKANDAVLGPDVLKPGPAGPRVLVTGKAAMTLRDSSQFKVVPGRHPIQDDPNSNTPLFHRGGPVRVLKKEALEAQVPYFDSVFVIADAPDDSPVVPEAIHVVVIHNCKNFNDSKVAWPISKPARRIRFINKDDRYKEREVRQLLREWQSLSVAGARNKTYGGRARYGDQNKCQNYSLRRTGDAQSNPPDNYVIARSSMHELKQDQCQYVRVPSRVTCLPNWANALANAKNLGWGENKAIL
ncbi:hypothetical protein F5887DRAFT_917494 [Amanita rubescens]|nr:hypothetical protein F5887DRAFT_917494 [Amanita rubescens]